MDRDFFVKKVEYLCYQKGVKPTNACIDAGIGSGFMADIKHRGRSPSIDKFERLAAYLGTTVGDLIGEIPPTVPSFPEHPDLVLRYDQLSEEAQQEVMAFIEFKRTQETKAAKGSIPLESLGDTRPAGVKEMEALKEETEDS
nr:helix-turn-helix transcriptional regulator [uncultured Oscillibacter sp.]